ncbi:DNA-binding protein [Salinisphaera sp. LB1]|nr:DNA-binding protein [Salinisphaera sp. LB1]
MDEATCRQLLASHHFGRIAVNNDPSPDVLPVNYTLHNDAIWFHTGEGTKQTAASRALPASFQIDGTDPNRHSGWSVLVRGRLALADRYEPTDLPDPWPGGDRGYIVALSIDALTGRRIPPQTGWVLPTHVWKDRDASDLMG